MSPEPTVVILALACCALAAGSVQAGILDGVLDGCFGLAGSKNYASAYARIERDLQSSLAPGDTIEAQMNTIRRLVENAKFTDCHRGALKQILKLESAVDHLRCTSESVQILSDNILATQSQAEPTKSLPRLSALVQHFVNTHARLCGREYVGTFRAILEILDKNQLSLVNGYCNRVIDKLWTDSAVEPRPDVGIGQFSLSDVGIADMTLGHLSTLANDQERAVLDPKTPMLKDHRKAQIGEMIRNYMVEPCKYYLRMLNTYVFVPYEFDFPENNDIPSKDEMDFYKALANRRICSALVKGEFKPLRDRLLHDLTRE